MKAMRILGITNLMRIDGFLTHDGRIVIFDPNTLSGMAPSSFLFRQAAEMGMSHTKLINHLIETELQSYGMLDTLKQKNKGVASMKSNKIRVGVLLGGRSNEKEISLESGRNIVYKLSPDKYEAIPLFVDKNLELHQLDTRTLVQNSTKEIEEHLGSCKKIAWSALPHLVDFVFIGLHGGEGENGTIQGTLETLGLPYNGSSVLASSLCMDKYRTNSFLASQGFSVPAHRFVEASDWHDSKEEIIAAIEKTIGFPVVVKPHDDGCSVFVSKAHNQKELEAALALLFQKGKTGALVEEYIVGMELTVGVIGNTNPQALPPSQAVANEGILSIEEKFLPGAGENKTPAPLPEEALLLVKQTMEKIYAAVGCSGYARIDCFYQSEKQSKTGKPRVVIIEINNLPALTPATCLFHQAAELGIKPMDFIDKLIQLGFEKHLEQV
jgi:D-alanine-D-alanine ligase